MNDAVFRDDEGKWNFWDQTGKYFYGPYDTEDEMIAAMADQIRRNSARLLLQLADLN